MIFKKKKKYFYKFLEINNNELNKTITKTALIF